MEPAVNELMKVANHAESEFKRIFDEYNMKCTEDSIVISCSEVAEPDEDNPDDRLDGEPRM